MTGGDTGFEGIVYTDFVELIGGPHDGSRAPGVPAGKVIRCSVPTADYVVTEREGKPTVAIYKAGG
jgi:hypothetical protein